MLGHLHRAGDASAQRSPGGGGCSARGKEHRCPESASVPRVSPPGWRRQVPTSL